MTPHQPLRSVSVKNACITRAGGAWINCVRVTSRTFVSVAIGYEYARYSARTSSKGLLSRSHTGTKSSAFFPLIDRDSERRRAGQDVDRLFFVLVFVGRLAPREVLRARRLDRIDQRHAGQHRLERLAIEDVNLASAARLLRMLLERRLEHRRAEMDAGELPRIHLVGEALGLDPRRADQLERPRRPARFRCVRAFEQHRARIDDRAVERRNVRRRHHERQAGLIEVHRSRSSPPFGSPRAAP